MALNKTALIKGCKDAFESTYPPTDSQDLHKISSSFASKIADAIEAYILSGDVQIGIAVETAGSASKQTGKTTSIGKIK